MRELSYANQHRCFTEWSRAPETVLRSPRLFFCFVFLREVEALFVGLKGNKQHGGGWVAWKTGPGYVLEPSGSWLLVRRVLTCRCHVLALKCGLGFLSLKSRGAMWDQPVGSRGTFLSRPPGCRLTYKGCLSQQLPLPYAVPGSSLIPQSRRA